jgi:hypothetical protein
MTATLTQSELTRVADEALADNDIAVIRLALAAMRGNADAMAECVRLTRTTPTDRPQPAPARATQPGARDGRIPAIRDLSLLAIHMAGRAEWAKAHKAFPDEMLDTA